MDPHKTLFLPYGLGVALVRDRAHLLEAFRSAAPYLQDTLSSVDEHSPADPSPAPRARRTRLTTHGRSVDWFGLTPVFADLEPAFLEALSRATMERALAPDEVLFRSGVPAEAIYVVVAGERG